MTKSVYINFRAEPKHERKVRAMAQALGVTVSDTLRLLVENAEVREVETLQPVATVGQGGPAGPPLPTAAGGR